MKRFAAFAFSILVLAVVPLFLSAQNAQGKRYALLVGVMNYEHDHLKPLRNTENDVLQFGALLKEAGYEVVVLCESEGRKNAARTPLRENIEREAAAVLAKMKRLDTLVIGLAGHGVQFEKDEEGKPLTDAYFCPADAKPFVNQRQTLISISKLYEDMDQHFGVKVLLVDACRNDPKIPMSGVNADNAPRPPRGVAALFSCSAGEKAWEHPTLKHGVFFHHVLEGMRGKARNAKGQVDVLSLAAYVNGQVSEEVPTLIGDGAKQSPNIKADLSGASPILLDLRPVASSGADREDGEGE